MFNYLKKLPHNILYQPENQTITIPAYSYLARDEPARLTESAYNSIKSSLYLGSEFDYTLTHSSWNAGSAQTFDDKGNIIQTANGWHISYKTSISGIIPPDASVPDSYALIPLGGSVINVPASSTILTFAPYYKGIDLVGWNAGAISEEYFDGAFEFSFKPKNLLQRGIICGVSADELSTVDQNYINILYAFYIYANNYEILESSVNPGFAIDTFISTDIFKIIVLPYEVRYLVNDIIVHTSARYDNYSRFRADCSLYLTRDTIIDAIIGIDPDISIFGGNEFGFSGAGFEDNTFCFGGGNFGFNSIGSEDNLVFGGNEFGFTSGGFEDNTFCYGGGQFGFNSFGDIGLLIPAEVAYGGGVVGFYSRGFVESDYLIGELIEDVYFDTVGTVITKPVINSRRYLCTITGTADSLPDIVVPISSINGNLSNSGNSSFQIVVPDGGTYAAAISARLNGGFIITSIELYSDGTSQSTDSKEFKIDTISGSNGARSYSITITGSYNFSVIGGRTVNISGQSVNTSNSGKINITCQLDKDLMPGDTVIPELGESFIVGSISWVINPQLQYMSVTEA